MLFVKSRLFSWLVLLLAATAAAAAFSWICWSTCEDKAFVSPCKNTKTRYRTVVLNLYFFFLAQRPFIKITNCKRHPLPSFKLVSKNCLGWIWPINFPRILHWSNAFSKPTALRRYQNDASWGYTVSVKKQPIRYQTSRRRVVLRKNYFTKRRTKTKVV